MSTLAMQTRTLTYAQAAALALQEAMQDDPNVIAMGEDLGRGGVFGQYRTPEGRPLAELFGAEVLQADGSLDRAYLRQRVFANPDERRALEAITHPAIRARVRSLCEAAPSPYAIAAIPLLTEAGGRSTYPWLQRILVVDTPEEVQHARLLSRDSIDAALAERMIQAQASRTQRLALADDVIINDGHPDALQVHIEALDARYRELAGLLA